MNFKNLATSRNVYIIFTKLNTFGVYSTKFIGRCGSLLTELAHYYVFFTKIGANGELYKHGIKFPDHLNGWVKRIFLFLSESQVLTGSAA
jgi:hypothetical protein